MMFAYMCVCVCVCVCARVLCCVCVCVCVCMCVHISAQNCTGWSSEGVNQEADKAHECQYASKTPGMGDSDVTFCMKTTICQFQFHA